MESTLIILVLSSIFVQKLVVVTIIVCKDFTQSSESLFLMIIVTKYHFAILVQ